MEGSAIRILHVWDQAGVAACLSKYQKNLGHQVTVVKLGNWDGKGIDEYYQTNQTYEPQNSSIYKTAKTKLQNVNFGFKKVLYRLWSSYPTIKLFWYVWRNQSKYDILHVHSMWSIVFFVPFKPKLYEFHGDDVRVKPSMYSWFRRLPARLFVNVFGWNRKLVVSTPDLLSCVPGSVWLPNIVDTEHFYPMPELRVKGSALYCSMWYENGEHAIKYAKDNGLHLTVLERKKNDWVDYREFPKYLNQFEVFIDRKEIHSLSKTALEALACGLKVVDWEGNEHVGLPVNHLPDVVTENCLKLYREVLKK